MTEMIHPHDVSIGDLVWDSGWTTPLFVTDVHSPTHPGLQDTHTVVRGVRGIMSTGEFSTRESVLTFPNTHRLTRDTDIRNIAVWLTVVCSECHETAHHRRPTALGSRGEWSHLDGEPLCPVVGDQGYEPCQPVTLLDAVGVPATR